MKQDLLRNFLAGIATSVLMPLSASAQTIAINEENFPDANFCYYLLSQDYGLDGILTDEEISGITEFDFHFQFFRSLKGIEYFTALTFLNCNSCGLTALDISKNTALTTLYIFDNLLTELDLSSNTALRVFYCDDNQLTILDVSKNAELEEFSCSGNQLTTLDVSKSTKLHELYCDGNRLTTLNISGCTALEFIDCSGNQIKKEAMDAIVNNLPQNMSDRGYDLYVYDETAEDEGNVCTKTQVATAKAKGWTVRYVSDWTKDGEYEGCDDEVAGIDALHEGNHGENTIYSLCGQKLDTTNVSNLPSGVYIINGRKIAIR